ncbi:acetyl/propionyl/methylcrotonyl-CoA carboxylase subunit alpha [Marinovum sp. 2_MG-2023]|uniref:acetyl/propionyl/methylcrotonyl-CoA carboxylase subunit alpha n=1 Tax=unclassified Marinovum TaxID=2647166 RepID=UPI0026E26674|nr:MULTISPECIES: acetyl/propionyl/methylcrotonyl-CoA carboxylase subunit alpha [unclassified Marinovum]MDO6732501.1 acetyl/propionyl/methylcrotonyl-CoA carboxylase subunit alpha [Marinovum sp. 2_MG-2023]MDO6780517.1 acetyl/propionyl/methylcrotonyl-CoA carboxylase subunit alpha [Marinovum sp. 1_MG-2023]
MFDTILIANRGEIACRVMRTAQGLGVRCVAVYSEADAGAAHVAMADEAHCIGGAAVADSYLRGDRIIEVALASGAQAIHPGYGFLSENPEFVDAVVAAGLVFIGPSAEAIRAMGLKDAAKALMEKAGVPVVPGYHGADQTGLQARAEEIGYPVLIKAVAGGGGKGMRLVEAASDFDRALESARAEARTAFGNDAVLIEKFVTKPRHIEVQVFGDGTRAVHLFERDCSLQRRHQKVIEEAPAPGMTEEMRAAMGTAAVRAAEAIGYSGAGTVEFIVDGSDGLRADGFWFMEMNTRLQVEHPVTEMITGVDLVEWQLRVAAGEPLDTRQEDLTINGHAFEARLYAEDVPAGFLPATGTLTHLGFPAGARADTGVRSGDEISPWYDPMIAKLITHGPTREIALKRLRQALARTEVAGSVTNLAFLGALAGHVGFGRGEVDTGLIGREIDALTAVPAENRSALAQAALIEAGLWQSDGWDTGFHLWQPLWRVMVLDEGETRHQLRLMVRGPGDCLVEIDGHQVECLRAPGGWTLDGSRAWPFAVAGDVVTVFADYGRAYRVIRALDRAAAAGSDASVIEAPMPGLVQRVEVAAGAKVSAGDRLAVLEAMKMEHALTAPRDGVVAEVLVAAGDQVSAGAALIRLEEEDDEAAA